MPGARIRKDVLHERGKLIAESSSFSLWFFPEKSTPNWMNFYVRRNEKRQGKSTFRFAHNGSRFSKVPDVVSLKSDHPEVFQWVEREISKFVGSNHHHNPHKTPSFAS